MTLGFGPILPMMDTAGQNDIFRQWADYNFRPIDMGQFFANGGFNANNNNMNNAPKYTPANPQFNVDRAIGRLNFKQLRELQKIEKEIRENAKLQSDITKKLEEKDLSEENEIKYTKDLEDAEAEHNRLLANLRDKENEYLDLGEHDMNPSESDDNTKYDLYTNINARELIKMNDMTRAADKFEDKLKRLQENLDMLTTEKKSYDAARIQAPSSLMEQYEKLRSNFSILTTSRDKKLTALSSYVKSAMKDTSTAKGTIGSSEARETTTRRGTGTRTGTSSTQKGGVKTASDAQNAKEAPKEVKEKVLSIIKDFKPEENKKSVTDVLNEIKKALDSNEPALPEEQREDALKVALNNLAEKKLNGTAIYEPAHTISEYIKNNIKDGKLTLEAEKFAEELIKANIASTNTVKNALLILKDFVTRLAERNNASEAKKAAVNKYAEMFANILKSMTNENNKKEIEDAINSHGSFKLLGQDKFFNQLYFGTEVAADKADDKKGEAKPNEAAKPEETAKPEEAPKAAPAAKPQGGEKPSGVEQPSEVDQSENPDTDGADIAGNNNGEGQEVDVDEILQKINGWDSNERQERLRINPGFAVDINKAFTDDKEANKELAKKIYESKKPDLIGLINGMVKDEGNLEGRTRLSKDGIDKAFRELLENVIKYTDTPTSDTRTKEILESIIRLETWEKTDPKDQKSIPVVGYVAIVNKKNSLRGNVMSQVKGKSNPAKPEEKPENEPTESEQQIQPKEEKSQAVKNAEYATAQAQVELKKREGETASAEAGLAATQKTLEERQREAQEAQQKAAAPNATEADRQAADSAKGLEEKARLEVGAAEQIVNEAKKTEEAAKVKVDKNKKVEEKVKAEDAHQKDIQSVDNAIKDAEAILKKLNQQNISTLMKNLKEKSKEYKEVVAPYIKQKEVKTDVMDESGHRQTETRVANEINAPDEIREAIIDINFFVNQTKILEQQLNKDQENLNKLIIALKEIKTKVEKKQLTGKDLETELESKKVEVLPILGFEVMINPEKVDPLLNIGNLESKAAEALNKIIEYGKIAVFGQVSNLTKEYITNFTDMIRNINGDFNSENRDALGKLTKEAVLDLEKLITEESSDEEKEAVYKNIMAILMLKSRIIRKKIMYVEGKTDFKAKLDKYIEEIESKKSSSVDFDKDLEFKTTFLNNPHYTEGKSLFAITYSDVARFKKIKENLKIIWFGKK